MRFFKRARSHIDQGIRHFLCYRGDIRQDILPQCHQYRTSHNRVPEASKGIDDGDEVEIDFNTGIITDITKGTTYQGQAFPEFMQKLIAAGGLVNYINETK